MIPQYVMNCAAADMGPWGPAKFETVLEHILQEYRCSYHGCGQHGQGKGRSDKGEPDCRVCVIALLDCEYGSCWFRLCSAQTCGCHVLVTGLYYAVTCADKLVNRGLSLLVQITSCCHWTPPSLHTGICCKSETPMCLCTYAMCCSSPSEEQQIGWKFGVLQLLWPSLCSP